MSDDEEGMTPTRQGSGAAPTRTQSDLADVIEILLEKGVVINADIAVSIGDTELLGVQIRAALASFETAAEYGLEFPTGTDMRRVKAASDREELPDEEVSVAGGVEGGDGGEEGEGTEGGEQDEGGSGGEQDEGVDDQDATSEEDVAPEADGGSPVAPLHPPPVSENAPWLRTPPIAEDPDETDTDADDRPRVEPGTASRPGGSGEESDAGEGSESDDEDEDGDGNEGSR